MCSHYYFLSFITLLLLTVAVECPESSEATLMPFERVVTLVSGTLYKDCNNENNQTS